jgi:hypothetical protein
MHESITKYHTKVIKGSLEVLLKEKVAKMNL